MSFKKFLNWIFKAVIACAIALAVVTGASAFYYNLSVHYTNPTGATDYKWESAFYSRCIEGFAHGRINNDGFNNIDDYNGQQIDILFMGSSHGEGFNVSQDRNCVSLMNKRLGGKMYTYNIATSGHTLVHNCRNLNAALDYYRPTKYVVMEVPLVSPRTENLQAVTDGTLPKLESRSGGIVTAMQKIPFFRLMYYQLSNLKNANAPADEQEESDAQSPVPDAEYEKALRAVIEKLKADCDAHGVRPIIIYHPHANINEDGTLRFLVYEDYVSLFDKVCAENGVIFINTEPSILDGYNREHKLPYGFDNTQVGKGHLNNYGHQLIADSVCDVIEETEAGR